MLFNSIDFAIFLPIVFALYWLISSRGTKAQNIILLLSSYYFYSCWDWRFLFLLLFSTFLDYFTGLKISTTNNNIIRKFWFWLSVSINLGFLGVFKYYNFFIASFAEAVSLFGININYNTLNVILPVGISFYTFHGLSYVIDIYNRKISPEKSYINYAVFVSFFPLLVAGPIERATHLLPQIINKRVFKYESAIDGLRQILWGLFKKIVIADNCAEIANLLFNDNSQYSGSSLFLGAIFFTFQIYCDFSGYSDIALGTARLFGFELLRNFAYPYFSRDIAEFWRRWHISLSSWFRDYLYIPLGGSKFGLWQKIRNTFIIFIVSGFWHGANWTFIFWGLINAIFILPSIVLNTNRNNLEIVSKGKVYPNIKEIVSIFFTFCITIFAWIFFRSNNLKHAFEIIKQIFSPSFLTIPEFPGIGEVPILTLMILILIIVEWIGRELQFGLQIAEKINSRIMRIIFYYIIIILILFVGNFSENQFIYFQF